MATDWTAETDITVDESDEWTSGIDEEEMRLDGHSWQAKPSALDPNATSPNTVLGFSGWTQDELRVVPEDFAVTPEEFQADKEDWTIQSEPD